MFGQDWFSKESSELSSECIQKLVVCIIDSTVDSDDVSLYSLAIVVDVFGEP